MRVTSDIQVFNPGVDFGTGGTDSVTPEVNFTLLRLASSDPGRECCAVLEDFCSPGVEFHEVGMDMFEVGVDFDTGGVTIPVTARRHDGLGRRFGARLLYDATEQARATERAQLGSIGYPWVDRARPLTPRVGRLSPLVSLATMVVSHAIDERSVRDRIVRSSACLAQLDRFGQVARSITPETA